ncbi:AAA family ATPase [Lichenifustis flavocetrariae]|uniref:AAA family ATPase n=1 Tax=Lichenifustis flavocetrariae TaxID=2949735 RepID=A0AA41Z3B8_9HYPH|nr:AAA family ATPase [Lichenifustis flavocetrariae]MCW6512030.1 AAA family ATPase [Lichenifustis flavocetrariae]
MRLIGAHTKDDATFRAVLEKAEQSPDLVRLGKDKKGQERFTSRQHQTLEQRMERHARLLHGQKGKHRDVAPQWAGKKLSLDQDEASRHVLAAPRLAAVIGYAGTDKSTMLDAARESWEKAGYTIKGAALSGIAADGLKEGAGIDSKTIHSRLFQWDQGQNLLTNKGSGHESALGVRFVRTDVELTPPAATAARATG